MKSTPKSILQANRRALKSADPRSRDRLRYRVHVMENVVKMLSELRKKSRSA